MSNIIQTIVDRFINTPGYLGKGAGYLAELFKVSRSDIYEAKEIARAQLHDSRMCKLQDMIEKSEEIVRYLGSKTTEENGLVKQFESNYPLTPAQIKELAGVDDITCRLGMVWDKLSASGKWTYSIQIKFMIENFYSKDELSTKLKELFPDTITSVSLPTVEHSSERALIILLSDEHAGAVNAQSLFGNEWNDCIYLKRLLQISAEVKALGQVFEEVHIICLGDQLNGWNSQTTRGGHEVKSLSNKEQFDIYTKCRKAFYDDLFLSGIAEEYFIHDVENSNHSGKDFSYIANQYLDLYVETKYPQVNRVSCFLPFEGFDYGIHTIGFGHGKDEILQTRPLPLKLDQKTDLLLFQYFDKKGYSPNKNRITFYKGDLHCYNVDKGKFGRYINIPSVMGSTDYSEINFGDTEAGAVLEILDKHNKRIQHIPIWF